MAISRYAFSYRFNEGKAVSISKASYKIHRAVQLGQVQVTARVLSEGERLDQLAGVIYGDGTLWWIIAAASGIGWGLQVPQGTRLAIPVNPAEVFGLLT